MPDFIEKIKTVSRKYIFGFLIFMLFLLWGLIGAKNFGAGIYGIIKFLEFSFLVVFVSRNFKNLNRAVVFTCLLISIAFESLLGFAQYLNQSSIGGVFYFFGERTFNAQTPGIANASINGQLFLRPYATFSHPNVFAAFLILAMLALCTVESKNITAKVMTLAGISLGSIALLTTLSRTAIFLWGVYLLIFFGVWMNKKYKKVNFNPKIFGLGILIILIMALIVSANNNLVLQRFISTKLSDESVVQRQELISQSLKMFSVNPVLGVGINNFYNNLTFNLANQRSEFIQPVHNIFLLVLSETGIIGLAAFLFLLAKSFLAIIKKQNKYLLLSFLAIIFLGMFDHYFLTLQQGQLMLSLLVGASLSK